MNYFRQGRGGSRQSGGTGLLRWHEREPRHENQEKLQFVDFGGEDEIAFREAVNFVRPGFNSRFSPGQENIGMMSLLCGDRTHLVYERECFGKIRKFKLAHDVMFSNHLPLRSLLRQILQFLAGERRNSSATRHASFIR